MARKRLSAGDSKAFILSQANMLFIEKGYDRATMDQLCQLTNMSKGNLYHHFKNKEELFLQVLTQYIEELAAKCLSPEMQELNPIDQLLAIADEFGRACKNPIMNASEEFDKTIAKDSEAYFIMNRNWDLIRNIMKQVIQKGIEQKELKDLDVELLTFSFASILVGAAHCCLSVPEMSTDEFVAYHVNAVQMLLKGISQK